MSEEKKVQRTVVGRVVSNKMDKTVSVAIERRIKHVSRCLSQLQSAYVQFSETDF